MTNPFDLKTAILARHAQHVVLIHFPIALFLAAVAFDLLSRWLRRPALAEAAYYNLFGAVIATLPALGTGLLAWRYQLESHPLRGILLLHLVFACVSSVMIWGTFSLHSRARSRQAGLPLYGLAFEILGAAIVALTGHLGGFLSGVNLPS